MKKQNLINNERGYALIEVIFFVTVIAILSSVVVPKIGDSLKIVQSDYLIKTVYSELRFIQALTRVTTYGTDKIFDNNKTVHNFFVVSDEKEIAVENQDNVNANQRVMRRYILPLDFHFENEFFMRLTEKGIFKNNYSKDSSVSNHIILKNKSERCRPFIIFDSVGRLRFSNEIK
ncbi:MAG: type II secretion system protein [Selenomonadaceae bacterium]|nr:type II secretion system protein [Selenomonadaceae bacterium]